MGLDTFYHKFFIQNPTFGIGYSGHKLKSGKDLYEFQLGQLSSALLLEDYTPDTSVLNYLASFHSNYTFPKGALISGSCVMHYVAKQFGNNHNFDDIDIYFQSIEQAKDFIINNQINKHCNVSFDNPMCCYFKNNYNEKINLIYGIPYDSPKSLIGRFDIRACSMAIDPVTRKLHVVEGALEDVTRNELIFNPVPRGVSMRRYAKYIKKGFTPDSYQNLFFAELIKSDIYKPELELTTNIY